MTSLIFILMLLLVLNAIEDECQVSIFRVKFLLRRHTCTRVNLRKKYVWEETTQFFGRKTIFSRIFLHWAEKNKTWLRNSRRRAFWALDLHIISRYFSFICEYIEIFHISLHIECLWVFPIGHKIYASREYFNYQRFIAP
jgi:hypothetical protein